MDMQTVIASYTAWWLVAHCRTLPALRMNPFIAFQTFCKQDLDVSAKSLSIHLGVFIPKNLLCIFSPSPFPLCMPPICACKIPMACETNPFVA